MAAPSQRKYCKRAARVREEKEERIIFNLGKNPPFPKVRRFN